MLIITSFLLSFSACGYKKAPYYQEKNSIGDKDITFILEKKSFPKKEDTNESCK